MTITIGRGPAIIPVGPVEYSGATLSFTGHVLCDDGDHMLAVRQQLAGLVDDRDEEVVPVVSDVDPTLDGFYRVRSVVARSAHRVVTNAKTLAVDVSLERLTGHANPWFEVTVQSTVRTNGHGVTAPIGVVSFLLDGYTRVRPSGWVTAQIIETADSSVDAVLNREAAPVALTQYQFACPPSLYGVGRCRIEVLYGATWYEVVGREVPSTHRWRISNGRIRLTAADGATPGTVEWYDVSASAWEPIDVTHSSGFVFDGIGFSAGTIKPAVSVLRNGVEEAVVSVSDPEAAAGLTATYRLTRGARHVEVVVKPQVAAQITIGHKTATACTSFTGGIVATNDDANGNRAVFGIAAAKTDDLVTGRVQNTVAATTVSMFIGVHTGGGSAGSTTTALAVRDEFLSALSWRQRVIVR